MNTYEMFNIHDYFLQFEKIHPYLFYNTSDSSQLLLKIQEKLIDRLNNKIISKDEMSQLYNTIKNIIISIDINVDAEEYKLKIQLEQFKSEQEELKIKKLNDINNILE